MQGEGHASTQETSFCLLGILAAAPGYSCLPPGTTDPLAVYERCAPHEGVNSIVNLVVYCEFMN